MRRLTLALSAALLIPGMAAQALDIPLEYVAYDFNHLTSFMPYGHMQLPAMTKPPDGEWKLPELNHYLPLYVIINIGGKERLAILDASDKDKKFYDRLYLDANSNRDLSDDTVTASTQTNDQYAQFMPVNMTIEQNNTALPYAFCLMVYCFIGGDNKLSADQDINSQLFVQLMLGCCYKGQAEIAGQSLTFFLGDLNVNGRFDETITVNEPEDSTRDADQQLDAQGDTLYVAKDEETLSYYHTSMLGSHLVVGEECYKIELNVSGKMMTLTPVTEGLVPVTFTTLPTRAALYGKDGGPSLNLVNPANPARIPQGTYRPMTYMAHKTGSAGDTWLVYAGATVKTPFTEITSSGGELAFGEPFLPVVSVPSWALDQFKQNGNEEVQLQFTLHGRASEQVAVLQKESGENSSVEMSSNNRAPKEPTYKILKPDGEVAAEGNFEYG